MITSCKRSIEPLTSIPWAMDMATVKLIYWELWSKTDFSVWTTHLSTQPLFKEVAGCQSDSGARTTCLFA
jgi:hypothetical protein